jgi:hypothetical protein
MTKALYDARSGLPGRSEKAADATMYGPLAWMPQA